MVQTTSPGSSSSSSSYHQQGGLLTLGNISPTNLQVGRNMLLLFALDKDQRYNEFSCVQLAGKEFKIVRDIIS